MSDGPVVHVGCGGKLVFEWGAGFVCDECGEKWDGKEKGVAEYPKEASSE